MKRNNPKNYWEQTGGDNLLGKYNNFQELFDSKPGNLEALKLDNRDLYCMDEGTQIAGKTGISTAGSSIFFLDDPEALDFLKGKITGVYSHELCGAVEAYRQIKKLTTDLDELAKQKGKEVANKVGVPYRGHILAEELKRPNDFHIARTIYYAFSEFNPSRINLPIGFKVDRWVYKKSDQAIEEGKIAAGIALGHHGFGGFINENSPLYLVGIFKKSENEQKDVLAELDRIKDDNLLIKVETTVI